jgi:hypothetical protein
MTYGGTQLGLLTMADADGLEVQTVGAPVGAGAALGKSVAAISGRETLAAASAAMSVPVEGMPADGTTFKEGESSGC